MIQRAGVRKRIAVAVLLIAATTCAQVLVMSTPAVATDGFSVDPGYDLFETRRQASSYALIAEVVGVPLGSYTFPATGSVGTGATDTVIRRLGTATPGNPVVQTEIEALHLKSVSPRDDLYVTLQKDRVPADLLPPGPPSVGTLHFQFNPSGTGGRLLSSFVVCYDVRLGGFAGTIIHSACDAVSGVQSRWAHDLPTADSRCLTEMGLLAKHGVFGPPARIAGVNHLLNGTNTTHDLVPGFDWEKPCDSPRPPPVPPSTAGSFSFVGTAVVIPGLVYPLPGSSGSNGTWTVVSSAGAGATTAGSVGTVFLNVSGNLRAGEAQEVIAESTPLASLGSGGFCGLSGGYRGTGNIAVSAIVGPSVAIPVINVGWVQSAASLIVFVGDTPAGENYLSGVVSAVPPNPATGGGSCTNGTAVNFTIVGSGQFTL